MARLCRTLSAKSKQTALAYWTRQSSERKCITRQNMSNTLIPWTRFWFEGNLFFGWINGPEDWQRLRDAYPDYSDERLFAAKRFFGASKPNFGFRIEHKGPGTLKDFFEDNGMEIPSKA